MGPGTSSLPQAFAMVPGPDRGDPKDKCKLQFRLYGLEFLNLNHKAGDQQVVHVGAALSHLCDDLVRFGEVAGFRIPCWGCKTVSKISELRTP